MLESKSDAQNHSISLKESDLNWLQEEYKKQKNPDFSMKFPALNDLQIFTLIIYLERLKQQKKS